MIMISTPQNAVKEWAMKVMKDTVQKLYNKVAEALEGGQGVRGGRGPLFQWVTSLSSLI
jgi:hypothetical protein